MSCKREKHKNIHKIVHSLVNALFWFCIITIVLVCFQIFLFTSFRIPSDSMAPELLTGDNVLVAKPIYGARLFNITKSLNNQQTDIYRVSGLQKVKHNDIVVFNFPHPNSWDKVEMHIMKYYIKRCIGLPGDSLQITDGFYQVKSLDKPLGVLDSQRKVSERKKESFEEGVYYGFPYDSIINWNIQHFGPLHIPQKDTDIRMDRNNYILYKKLIEWEQGATLTYRDSIVYLGDQPIQSYQFRKNYYFVAGDRTEDSQDSRYWGLLPEEYIVGKAWVVWKSIDPLTGKLRWDRFLKKID